ncbi:M16 family metallopeptidase [Natronoflexus pectinivorans]|uniref:Putative Zn-dependent peptidase n=1 Tax=Natronoflexus pectinivorans TaxID=682526 RepID=A0A4R2GH94_9BACT|nr:pitrilysin family protein [Natronoflexus pectinivorans]TCO07422.1 putative Zn-dependent peptidase [Natronoflexus pectinivorans]
MIEIYKHQLANGLKIVVHPDITTPLVAVNLLYDVGARDEAPDKTGFAHLFEHLMFGGSVNVPSYDEPLQRVGGENNAWTSNDFTNYYVTLPAANIETAFWLESDRMLELNFTDKNLEVQRKVVIEEFKQRYLNQPYGDIPLLTRPMAYKQHPYQWPTIGKDISHIENATMDDVKNFFYRHYAPNNAVLAVSGNVQPDRVFRLAEKWFGDIPRRDVPVRNIPRELPQQEARFLEVERDVPAHLLNIHFHIGARRDDDFYINDLLSDILSNGPSSRLIQSLIKDKQLFSDVNAYISGDMDPGLFTVTGRLMPGKNMKDAEDAVWNELHSITSTMVDDRELQKVKNKIESNLVFAEISFLNKAMNMAQYELMGDAENINREIEHYRAVTAEQIQATAGSVFRKENSSTLHYLAEKA